MKYWLMKSKTDIWSIDQQIRMGDKGTLWDEVKIISLQNLNGRWMKTLIF